MAAADGALHAAKALGRDRAVIYSPEVTSVLGAVTGRRNVETQAQLATVLSLAEALDQRDSGTARHSQTVGRLCEMMARELGMDEDRVQRLRLAGILHDIGKIAVPDSILCKPGPLTDDEWVRCAATPSSAPASSPAASSTTSADGSWLTTSGRTAPAIRRAWVGGDPARGVDRRGRRRLRGDDVRPCLPARTPRAAREKSSSTARARSSAGRRLGVASRPRPRRRPSGSRARPLGCIPILVPPPSQAGAHQAALPTNPERREAGTAGPGWRQRGPPVRCRPRPP